MNREDWDAIWINCHLATMSGAAGEYGDIENAALAVKDGRIVWIGAKKDIAKKIETKNKTTIHDAKGRWITPGLIDCHTHLIFGGNRAREFELRLKGASYEELQKAGGGILSTVKATRSASDEELFNSAIKRIKFFRREGVTTIEIKSGYGLNLESELKMLRVARQLGQWNKQIDIQTTFLGAHALPEEYQSNQAGYLDLVVNEMLPAVVEEGLADAVDGFCEGIAFSQEEIERVFSRAQELNLSLKLHADQLSDLNGAGLAADYGALSADHLEYTSESSVKKMSENGTVAVLLPGAYYTLRETQLPPVQLFRDFKVPIAIATDANPGSSPVFSLLLMLNMACTFFSLTPAEALAGVTRNAAQALGLAKDRGTLEVGKRADFVLWDIEHPSELAYMVGTNPCVSIIKSGSVCW